MNRIRHVIKWAVAEELVPPSVLEGLRAVVGLKRWRMEAKEPKGVRPVADSVIDATLPCMTATVRAMVEFQRYTGCRLQEVCLLRTCDVDTGGKVWVYTPHRHKTQHHGRSRQNSSDRVGSKR